jgi:hypothetical protein
VALVQYYLGESEKKQEYLQAVDVLTEIRSGYFWNTNQKLYPSANLLDHSYSYEETIKGEVCGLEEKLAALLQLMSERKRLLCPVLKSLGFFFTFGCCILLRIYPTGSL